MKQKVQRFMIRVRNVFTSEQDKKLAKLSQIFNGQVGKTAIRLNKADIKNQERYQ